MTSTASHPASADVAGTVVDTFIQRTEMTPHRHGFYVMTAENRWSPVDWVTCARRVRALAAGLTAANIGRGDRVAICACTSLEWELAQMSALYTGASVVGLDPNYPDALLAQLLGDSGAQMLIAQNSTILARLPDTALRKLKLVVTIDNVSQAPRSNIRSLNDFAQSEHGIAAPLRRARPEDEALIVYSSGTTGTPKAIAYRHDQLSLALRAILDAFSDIDAHSTLVCWLPLSNLFQRMINLAAMARGATSYIVEDPRSVMDHVRIAHPRVFIGVPRFFEKAQAGITNQLEQGSRVSSFFAKRAIELGDRRARALRSGTPSPLVVRVLWPLVDRWILARIRATFGADLRYFVSGSAPMPRWLLEWFDAIGLPVLEAYGVSEDIVPIATNRQGQRRLGTVGRPMRMHEVKLAEDGEILVRGPGVAVRGNGNESLSNKAAVSGDFLATGDLGEFDSDGFLRIAGRKSDVFKSSTGKWVVPSEIEGRLARLPYIEHAVVSGAGRNALIGILSVAASDLNPRFTREGPVGNGDGIQLDEGPANHRIRVDVAAALADLPSHQQLAGILIVSPAEFSVAGGELTTNLKIRRKHVERKFAADIERLYLAMNPTPRPHDPIVVATTSCSTADAT